MKAIKYLFIILFLIAVSGLNVFAQILKPEPLNDFLLRIQKRFDVVFTYADESIKGIDVVIPNTDLSLEEYLSELEKQTALHFRKLDSRYISIQKRPVNREVSGVLHDKISSLPVEGAFIYSGRSYTLSDRNGYFTIKTDLEKDTVIVVRHTGYEPLLLGKNAWNNDSTIYELVTDLQEIDEVVINYIARGIDKLPDGSIQLNVQNLEVLPGLSEPDVLHSIQVLPGIQSINETVADINTRGGTNDQSLVLWDGVKMYQTGHFFGLISAFNSHLVHKTRVVKNGAKAAFDEGISGIVDMKLQDYHINNIEVNASLNMVSGDLIMKLPLSEKLSVVLGARHSINELILTPTYKSYYNRAFDDTEVILNRQSEDNTVDKFHDFTFYDLSGKLLFDLTKKDRIAFSVLNISNNIKYEESAVINDIPRSRESSLEQSSLLSNLVYSRCWNNNHSTKISAYLSHYFLDGTNVSLQDNEHHLQENEVIDWGIKFDAKNRVSTAISLNSGYQFKEVGIRNLDNIRYPGYSRDAKDVLRIHSVYAELESKERLNKLYVRAGLRADYFSKFNSFEFAPALVLNYKLSKSFSLEALAELKNQHTTQLIDYQTDFLGIEKRRWVLSNEKTIPFLKGKQVSLGMQYNRNNLLVSLEAYLKNVNGIITPSQGFQNQFQSVYAIGEYNTHGMELLINKRFKKSNLWSNYTLAKNDYRFEALDPSVFPNNFDIRHTLSFGGTYTVKQFEFSGGFNYRTGKPYTKPATDVLNEENEILYEAPNSSRLDEYFRLDVSAKYHFKLKKVKGEMGFSVWNVMNRDNVINIYFRKNENNEIEQVTQNALGITPNVSLRLRF